MYLVEVSIGNHDNDGDCIDKCSWKSVQLKILYYICCTIIASMVNIYKHINNYLTDEQ